jgi:GNAT superfamily N-acetyltransferase
LFRSAHLSVEVALERVVDVDDLAQMRPAQICTQCVQNLCARLAVDLQHQGAGLGKALLKDALLRTAQAADIAGIRALLVHAKDEPARQWYLNWEFEPSPSDPLHLFLLMKDIKALVGSASG